MFQCMSAGAGVPGGGVRFPASGMDGGEGYPGFKFPSKRGLLSRTLSSA